MINKHRPTLSPIPSRSPRIHINTSKRKLEPIDDSWAADETRVGAVPWTVLRVKLRNPNLKDLPKFMGTLTRSDKLQLLKLMEEDFSRLHYYYNRLVPDSYRAKDGKSDLI